MSVDLNPEFLDTVSNEILSLDDSFIRPSILAREAKIERKSDGYDGTGDFVTTIDTVAQQKLLPLLKKLVPDAFTCGEEDFDENLDANMAALQKGYAWIIDPLDGTNNVKKYVAGEQQEFPKYGVMAALLKDGQPVAGWVMAVTETQERTMIAGAKGVGCFLMGGTPKRLNLRDATPQQPLCVITTVSAFPEPYQTQIKDNLAETPDAIQIFAPPPKSAAHEITCFLQNKADVAAFRQFRVWDHYPGLILTQEAGGVVKMLNSETPELKYQKRHGILYAKNETEWQKSRHGLLRDVPYVI
jgi:fructose-1,6-bisphosphatase/inositol monophosphatase family enzyme